MRALRGVERHEDRTEQIAEDDREQRGGERQVEHRGAQRAGRDGEHRQIGAEPQGEQVARAAVALVERDLLDGPSCSTAELVLRSSAAMNPRALSPKFRPPGCTHDDDEIAGIRKRQQRPHPCRQTAPACIARSRSKRYNRAADAEGCADGAGGRPGTLDVALAHARRLLARDPAMAAEQAREILRAVPGHPATLLLLGEALARWPAAMTRRSPRWPRRRGAIRVRRDAWRLFGDVLHARRTLRRRRTAPIVRHVEDGGARSAAATGPRLRTRAKTILPAAEPLLRAHLGRPSRQTSRRCGCWPSSTAASRATARPRNCCA